MSIIAVEKTKNKITFIADTQMTYCDEPMKTEKLFETDKYIFGLASDNQPHLAFKDYLQKIEQDEKPDLDNVIAVYKLIQNFKEFRLNDDIEMSDSLKFSKDDQLLIADKDLLKVFHIQPHSMTSYEIEVFDAVGSGATFAIGAHDAGASIEEAVKVACERNIYCSEPLSIINIAN